MLYTKTHQDKLNKPVEAGVDGRKAMTLFCLIRVTVWDLKTCFISHSLTDDGEQIRVNGLTLITTRAYTSQSSHRPQKAAQFGNLHRQRMK